MINFKTETLKVLELYNLDVDSILYVSMCPDDEVYFFKWEDFIDVCDFEYDNGYGGVEINSTLIVVGDTWWLERNEYDGSEWWTLKRPPLSIPGKFIKPSKELLLP